MAVKNLYDVCGVYISSIYDIKKQRDKLLKFSIESDNQWQLWM